MKVYKGQLDRVYPVIKRKYYFYYQIANGWLMLSTDSGKLYFQEDIPSNFL